MYFTNSHKTKGKTAIAWIGTMPSMVDFSSLCINMDTIITAICSNDESQPILRKILLNFVAIVNNPDWVYWSDNVGSMPLLHWNCYSFLKQIFNSFANFATDFGNDNIMSEAHPITKLNTSTLKSALTVLKTLCYQINLHQATMTAIISCLVPSLPTPLIFRIIPRPADQEKMKEIPPWMAHLVPLPALLSRPNSIMEASATLQHLI
jgi:hypothetical protein